MVLRTACLMGVCALGLTGPAGAADMQPTATSKKAVATAKTPEHGHHQGLKANGSGVRVDSSAPKSIAVGETVRVTLSFDGVTREGATATVVAPEGLTVRRADGGNLDAIALESGRKHQVALIVLASQDGSQYLNITTRQGDRSSIAQVAVRVGTGQVRLKPSGTVVTTPSGERIISMESR